MDNFLATRHSGFPPFSVASQYSGRPRRTGSAAGALGIRAQIDLRCDAMRYDVIRYAHYGYFLETNTIVTIVIVDMCGLVSQ